VLIACYIIGLIYHRALSWRGQIQQIFDIPEMRWFH